MCVLPQFSSYWTRRKVPFIVKPTSSSQGKGIYIISHPSEVPQDETLILSEYIVNPLLIDGFKFGMSGYPGQEGDS